MTYVIVFVGGIGVGWVISPAMAWAGVSWAVNRVRDIINRNKEQPK